MPHTAIYTRISSDPLHDKLGVQRQQQACEELCTRNGWHVVAVFQDDDVSAFSGKRRPQYEAMLAAIADGSIKAVVSWHPDRLHRSSRELEAFIDLVEQHRVKVTTVQAGEYDLSTASGRMTARVVGAVARGESEHKSERLKARMAQNAERGLPGGGSSRPYGYADDKLTVVPEEAAFIRESCDRMLNGESLIGIARWLNESGSRTTTGRTWTPSRVKVFGTNPRYAGLRSTGKRENARVVGDAAWPAIIDRRTHDRLRMILLDPNRRKNRSARRYLLSGLVTCKCKATMLSHPRTDRPDPEEDGSPRRFYVCVSMPGRESCGRNQVRARELEVHVARAAVRKFAELAAQGAFKPKPIMVDDAVAAELAVLDTKARKLGDAWAADLLDDVAFESANAGLQDRRRELTALVRHEMVSVPLLLTDLAAHPSRVQHAWDKQLSFDQRRVLLRALVDTITITRSERRAFGFDLDRVHVAWKGTAA